METLTRKFNVLCVRYRGRFHTAVDGPADAELIAVRKEAYGIAVEQTRLRFQGSDYILVDVTTGLDAMVVTFIVADVRTGYMRHLYSDIPAKGDSAEAIHRNALSTIERYARAMYL
ncbi:MAG: hypothetical protein RLZZ342_389 [Candidatus Parcubacteria bacterium]|jgi:hypothetical protein